MAKKYTGPQMRRHFALRTRHGLTWAELSQRVDIPVSTLQWWSARVSANEADEDMRFVGSSTPFVELAVKESTPIPASQFEIDLPQGITIRVPHGFDAEELSRIVAAVSFAC